MDNDSLALNKKTVHSKRDFVKNPDRSPRAILQTFRDIGVQASVTKNPVTARAARYGQVMQGEFVLSCDSLPVSAA